ncbi:MAG: aminopeptidase, partial [Bacteroidaceae bacterium]|nr:aminopeptidase [Bacteroidaceae bacterium]
MKKIITAYLVISLFVLDVMAQSQSTDFLMKLKALPGVSDIKPLESDFFKEKYVMKIQQNLDGDDASKGVFNQRIIVGLRGLDRPTVIVTEGYFAHYALYPSYKEELCQLFDANVVVCEYRYFAESVPEIVSSTNNASAWDYLTVDNSLRDIHHVRQTMGQIFKGKWVSTGISKGGQTTMFYRATYPDDVDVSVSYVAP